MITEYAPPKQVKKAVSTLRRPHFPINLSYLVGDYLLIVVPSSLLVVGLSFWLAASVLPVIAVMSARGLRGLECLVHDGSHYNIISVKASPKRRFGSDMLVNVTCAIPVFSTVQNYRRTHDLHHRCLGTPDDPDFRRHLELGIFQLDRERPLKYIATLLRLLPRYWMSWWRAIGTDTNVVALALLWHLVALLLASTAFGFGLALKVWMLGYLFPFIIALPILRFVGEAAEHDYENDFSAQSKTYSNTGLIQRLIIHPHNDGYHTLHHLFPHVPHHNLGRLDEIIKELDFENFRKKLRNRKGIFQNV